MNNQIKTLSDIRESLKYKIEVISENRTEILENEEKTLKLFKKEPSKKYFLEGISMATDFHVKNLETIVNTLEKTLSDIDNILHQSQYSINISLQ